MGSFSGLGSSSYADVSAEKTYAVLEGHAASGAVLTSRKIIEDSGNESSRTTSFASNNFKNTLKSWGSRIGVSIGALPHQFEGEKAVFVGSVTPMFAVGFVRFFKAAEDPKCRLIQLNIANIHEPIISSQKWRVALILSTSMSS